MDAHPTSECGDRIESDLAELLGIGQVVAMIRCRLEVLRRAGCDAAGCVVLAGRLEVDLDRAVDLVAHGCSPELAVRILV